MLVRLRLARSQQSTAIRQPLPFDAVGQQAVVADATEAVGQDMLEKAAEKLLGRKDVDLLPVPVLAVPTAKARIEAPPAAREKPARKKRGKVEGERAPRARKSEKRVIEEKIELAESEMEAMAAIKEQEEVPREEITAKEKKEEVKAAAPKETSFGLFAEKLKSALDKKKKEKKKEEDKE